MLFPRKEEVLAIHGRLIEQFGGRPGIRAEGLLDSALLSAANRQHYEGAGLATCAATYAFHLTASNDEIVELFLGIAAGTMSREQVERVFARWVVVPA